MKFHRLTLILVAVMLSPHGINAQQRKMFTDPRDGQVYPVVVIGGREWLASNLNYHMPQSWCYNNDKQNCSTYGRLYTFSAATRACPPGWTLPSEKDWSRLLQENDYQNNAIELMTGGKSGLDISMSGLRYEKGTYNYLGENAYFWSNPGNKTDPPWIYVFTRDMPSVPRIHSFPANAFSVRCVKK